VLFWNLLPKLIAIGSFYLPTYGVLVALGFLAGLSLAVKLGRRSGLPAEKLTNLAVYVALAGLAGAKILMIVFDWGEYSKDFRAIFSLSTLQAAGVYQGGLILALVTAYFYMRKQGLPLLETSDAFAPGVALGHAIGRLGCLAAGCCYGIVCKLPWAITFHDPEALSLSGTPLETPLHPTQLYEFGTEGLLCLYLYWRFGKAHQPGKILGQFLLISSLARFVIEFFRFHEQGLPFGLPLSITQWIALALGLAGVALLVRPTAEKHVVAPA
jgi:phosphatidylglycerol:prolipoprotein diacylglycerol transferase